MEVLESYLLGPMGYIRQHDFGKSGALATIQEQQPELPSPASLVDIDTATLQQ